MADLDFKRKVPEIPAGQALPETKRSVTAEVSPVPDYQSAFSKYAADTNWMSGLGSAVATKASNAIATKLGGEAGQTPHGDLGPSITDYDKAYAESYKSQAQTTLGLQASELITNSNLEMAKAPRITPELIASTNQQVSQGLNNIFKNAPAEIRPNLEYTYGQQQINQGAQVTERMFREQREDNKNTLITASKNIAEQVYSLSKSNNPKDQEAARLLINSNDEMNDVGIKGNWINVETAKASKDTVRQVGINGSVYRQAEKARNEGKLTEFWKDYANNKPKDYTDEQWLLAGKAAFEQMNFLDSMRKQDENLVASKFKVQIALHVGDITETDISELKTQVTPSEFETLHLDYINALKKYNKEQTSTNHLMNNFSDTRAWANATEKEKNTSFNNYVEKEMQKGTSRDNAEIIAAKNAGGVIPALVKSLENGLGSSNLDTVNASAQQLHMIYEIGAGNAITGISPQSKAMYNSIAAIRDSMDPVKALQDLHESIYSQDSDKQAAYKDQLDTFISTSKTTGMSDAQLGLKLAGLSEPEGFITGGTNFLTKGDAILYGNDLLNEFRKNFVISGGNMDTAKNMLKDSVRENFGTTYMNGFKQTTKHPLEKVYNMPEDSAGVFQEDLMNQLQVHFESNKKRFDEGQDKEYWSLTPRERSTDLIQRKEEQKESLTDEFKEQSLRMKYLKPPLLNKYLSGSPIEVIRHFKNGKSEKYTVVIKSNPFASTTNDPEHPTNAGWDVAVNSGNGIRNIAREAPYLGIVTYDPNIKFVKSTYLKLHPLQ